MQIKYLPLFMKKIASIELLISRILLVALIGVPSFLIAAETPDEIRPDEAFSKAEARDVEIKKFPLGRSSIDPDTKNSVPREIRYVNVQPPGKNGVVLHDSSVDEGYILFTPMYYNNFVYLINMAGELVHSWECEENVSVVYLLENGNLLTAGRPKVAPRKKYFEAKGARGIIKEYDWSGTVVWEYNMDSMLDTHEESYWWHHDIEPMPNGNILLLVWKVVSSEEAGRKGRKAALLDSDSGMWIDTVIELNRDKEVVWMWSSFDHIVQDHDPTIVETWGNISENPERINLNPQNLIQGGEWIKKQVRVNSSYYIDWTHTNSIDYNPHLDQILLSVLRFGEIWVIDHSTSTEEAATNHGGRYRKGGDLLYRWGNPYMYGRAEPTDRFFYSQHDAHWIPEGRPGASNILVFNNGLSRAGPKFSSIEEISPEINDDGDYLKNDKSVYEPLNAVWSYSSPDTNFYSKHISSAQRLPNGNTFICQGRKGRLFEIDTNGTILWDYYYVPGNQTELIYKKSDWNRRFSTPNSIFRAHKYSPDYTAFDGKELKPRILKCDKLNTEGS